MIHPITLIGRTVQLEPLDEGHAADLANAGSDVTIWKYMRYGVVDTQEKMRAFIADLLALQAAGADLPFAVIHSATGKAIGMTRYLNIEPSNRAVEIGGTWYGTQYQRTSVNTECKYLLLEYAFEKLECVRVQFKTDVRNARSQKALECIGCVHEGVLRDHMILPDGTMRSSVFYSILAREWPLVKQHLLEKLEGVSAQN
jgi:RimJ/RimL family protein N-acetyltransferase